MERLRSDASNGSQLVLATQLGIDRISQWRREQGQTDWPVSQLVTYAVVLGIHPSRLVAAALLDVWPEGHAPDAAYAEDVVQAAIPLPGDADA